MLNISSFTQRLGELVTRSVGYLTLQLYAPTVIDSQDLPRTEEELKQGIKEHIEAEVVVFHVQPDGTEKIVGVVKHLPGARSRVSFGFKFTTEFHIVRANLLNAAQQKQLNEFHSIMSQQAPRKKKQRA